ncbi:MAG TPA: tetratricopeptide repeat protein, partial [Pyrinomonadaceae bacterium]|nr:tetratricopeptide repeat protein [Pyrinomonadaceae bacterium]
VVFEGGKLSHEPTEATYRTITYYFDETIAKIVKPTSTHAAAHAASSAANTVDQVETGSRLPADGETASKTDVPDKRRSAVLPAITALDKLGLLIGPVGTEVVPATSAASPAIKLIAASEDAPAWSATAPTAGANDTPLAKTETEAAKSMTPLTPPAASIPAHPKDSQVEVKVSSTEPPKTNSTTNISSDAAVKSNSAPTLGMPFAEAAEYNKAGLSHYEAGRYREAAEAYERASALAPADALTYNNLGTAYSALGRFKEAVEAYKQAARLQPEVAEVHVNLGNAYYQLKKHAEAMKEFKLAISLQPLNVEAHYGLGLANYGLHRYREAIEAFKRAIQLEPERAEGHYAIALSYQEVKDTESLMNHYRILQRLDKELARSLAETFPTIEMPCRHPPCR